ncbi:MAG: DEAD/DEAH box helicase [Planctomycetota bacterium]|nr:MAG: DEAD/DEAH box helicase [Planctomycetota bacterium]
MRFQELKLLAPILRAVAARGYDTPTPIQAQAIPPLLEGRDLLGIAQTGTGKTAAFALPILDFLGAERRAPRPRRPHALVLTPTRELAAQVSESFQVYGKHLPLRSTVIFGGVGQLPQVRALERGVDVLVATPGRLLDLMQQKYVDLRDIEVFVLDEADRMLDMGFLPDVRRVIARLPKDRQSLLFSATMPKEIADVAHSVLHEPLRVEVTPPATTVERIDQRVMLVEKKDKRKLLREVLGDSSIERVLVFTRTKYGADRVVRDLRRSGESAEAIHGDKSQRARERALTGFRSGKVRALVATDIAARGIDVKGVTHVINFDLPNIPESYVHRIGRTARAGEDGIALSFCDTDEREHLFAIEKATGQKLEIVRDHPHASATPFERPQKKVGKRSDASAKRRRSKRSGASKRRAPKRFTQAV